MEITLVLDIWHYARSINRPETGTRLPEYHHKQ